MPEDNKPSPMANPQNEVDPQAGKGLLEKYGRMASTATVDASSIQTLIFEGAEETGWDELEHDKK